jgi:ABC-type transport system substrate-binding protein
MVIYCNGETVDSLNPNQASTVYEWNVINPTTTGLIQVNPYTHRDMPWVATNWEIDGPITETVTLDSDWPAEGLVAGQTYNIVDGMKVTYNLRSDVTWQDGNAYGPDDAEFSIEFLRDNQIPRYTAGWEPVVDVQVVNATAFTVYSRDTGQFFLYDWADYATLLPPQVWSWLDGQPLPTILGYPVWENTTDTGPISTPTQLIGVGPMIFQGWDPVGQVSDLHARTDWFISSAEIEAMLGDMFHAIGDCSPPDYPNRNDAAAYDGIIDGDDQTVMSLSFGYGTGDTEFAPHADIDDDGLVGGSDTSLLSFYFSRKRSEEL